MHILVLSNLYPPHYIGGCELGCQDVVERLRGRGYEISVLTSTYGLRGPTVEGDVYRVLNFQDTIRSQREPIWRRIRRELHDNRALKERLVGLKPDLVMVWDTWGLLKTLLITLKRTGLPVLYAISSPWPLEYHDPPDRWFTFWKSQPAGAWKRLVKAAWVKAAREPLSRHIPLQAEALDLRFAFFTSRALKEQHLAAGLPVQGAEVIHWGIPLERYPRREHPAPAEGARLLYAGRVVREKGVHTAIEAVSRLVSGGKQWPITLDIVGNQLDGGYLESLKRMVMERGLEGCVRFVGCVSHEEMPGVYNAHNVLLFPSIWDEPFSLTILEAMACGLPVVGTATGGSGEVLVDGENSLIFPPGDSVALADSVQRLLGDGKLCGRIAAKAAEMVRRDFDIEGMVDRIEALLGQHREIWDKGNYHG